MGVTAAIGAVAGAGTFSAASSFMGGRAEGKAISEQAEYNAQVYEQQAAMINAQKKISNYKHQRRIGKMRGAHAASAAGRGLNLTGSPLRVMADTESQMLYDQAIDNYNLTVQQNYYKHGAAMTRYEGSMGAAAARQRGTMGAFSTLLNTGVSMAGMGLGGGAAKPDIFTSAGPGYRNFGSIPVVGR